MSVAALSTASTLIGNVPLAPGTAANPAAVNDTQPFATLIGKPASEEKASKGDAKAAPEPEADSAHVVASKTEDSAPSSDSKKDESPTNGESDLLAEIEAMVAAASQLVVVPAPVAAMAAATPAKLVDTAKTVTTDVAAAITATLTAKSVKASPTEAPSSGPTPAETSAADGEIAAAPAAVTPAVASAPGNGKDIASIIAALKASVDQQAAPATPIQPYAEAAIPLTPEKADIVMPSVIAAKAEPAAVTPKSPDAVVAPKAQAARADTKAETPKVAAATTTAAPTDAPADAPAAVTIETLAETATDTVAAKDVKTTTVAKPADAPIAPMNIMPAEDARPAPAVVAPAAQPGIGIQPQGPAPRAAEAAVADVDNARPGKPHRDVSADDRNLDASFVAAAQLPAGAAADTDAPAVDSATSTLANQSVDRQLDLARDTQWLDRLARDISQAATQQGNLKFHLNPEHLGALVVEIAHSAAGTSIKMTTDNDQARAIIADAQPRLIAEVRAQGLQVADTQVDLSNQQRPGGGNAQMAGQQMADGQQRRSSEDHKPFSTTPANQREVPGDSGASDNGELYA